MKKKILFIGFVNLNNNTGDASHFSQMTQFMRQSFEVYTITIGGKTEFGENALISFPGNTLVRQFYVNFIVCLHILYAFFKFRIDTVYMRASGAFVFPIWFAKLLRLKMVLEINGVLVHDLKTNPTISKIIHKIYKTTFKFVDLVTASKGWANLTKKTFDIPERKVLKLTLGYSNPSRASSVSESILQLDLPPEKSYFLFIGNIQEYQGMQHILKAFKKFKAPLESKNVLLIILGDGNYKEYLVDYVKEHDLTSLVTFKEKVNKEKLHNYLSIGAVGLSPFDFKRGERKTVSSLKTFDYLFFKMPIVTSIMDDFGDTIMEFGIGEVIRDYSEDEIYKIITSLLNVERRNDIQAVYDKIYPSLVEDYSWNARFTKIRDRILSL